MEPDYQLVVKGIYPTLTEAKLALGNFTPDWIEVDVDEWIIDTEFSTKHIVWIHD